MNTTLLGLLAETSIHPGAGQSAGIVDLPVAREAATDYPVIPGSSLKGALLGFARQRESNGQERMAETVRDRIFGKSDNAGGLLVTDARLLLLPVRSLSSASKWITCPHLLERLVRDQQRAGKKSAELEVASAASGKYLGAEGDMIFLEERQFEHYAQLPDGLADALAPLIPETHENTRGRLKERLVVLHDDDFVWFARYGLAIQARNALDPDKKTSNNLWYEETIPADTLFYTVLAERDKDAIEPVKSLIKSRPFLQVGGNETVGMGWFAVTFPEMNGAAA